MVRTGCRFRRRPGDLAVAVVLIVDVVVDGDNIVCLMLDAMFHAEHPDSHSIRITYIAHTVTLLAVSFHCS